MTPPLTGAELGWLRAYSAWTLRFYDSEPDVGKAAVESCRDELERVGPAPTPRFEEAASRLSEICPLIGRLGSVARAQDTIELVEDDLVLPLLRDEQPLELRAGVTRSSRADIVLSEVASDVVGYPVEVRCWDDADWTTVVAEDNAWNDDDAHPDDLVGWSDDRLDRIHLVLDMCNTITRTTEGKLSASRNDRVDVIDAIETLAHEIQHFRLPDADEAEVECSAIRILPRFTQRFGVDAETARALTELYRTEVYPDLDEEYTAGGCPPA